MDPCRGATPASRTPLDDESGDHCPIARLHPHTSGNVERLGRADSSWSGRRGRAGRNGRRRSWGRTGRRGRCGRWRGGRSGSWSWSHVVINDRARAIRIEDTGLDGVTQADVKALIRFQHGVAGHEHRDGFGGVTRSEVERAGIQLIIISGHGRRSVLGGVIHRGAERRAAALRDGKDKFGRAAVAFIGRDIID